MSPNPQFPANLATFTEDILNRNFFLCIVGHTFLILYRIAHFLRASFFALALFLVEPSILKVFIILSPKKQILVLLFNDISFLFCRFFTSGVKDELKILSS